MTQRMIFVNLPVADLEVSRRFYTGLGFDVNETFSDDQCVCVVVSDAIVLMLLQQKRFRDFITTEIADARTTTEVLNGLSAASREEADRFATAAVALGGTARPGLEDGPMYGTSFTDPDGHIWEVLHMATEDVAA